MDNTSALIDNAAAHTEQRSSFLFMRMERAHVLIVGGGMVALRQLQEILANAPRSVIKVVGKSIHGDIRALASLHSNIEVILRDYTSGDLQEADIIFITAKNSKTVEQIENDAVALGLINVPIIQNGDKPFADSAPAANETPAQKLSYKRIAIYAVAIFGIMLLGHFIFSYLPLNALKDHAIELYHSFNQSFLIMLAAGFIAQLVDGALGMGYGVASTTILLSAGVNPAAISGSIHTAEMFASGASGYSHYKFGNVNKKLFKKLLVPGVIGAIAGAVLLVYLGEKYSDWVRPLLAFYTLFLGLKILYNAFKKQLNKKKFRNYGPLAAAGGFFDSFGGGGWGPIVTTTLITKGRSPRYVIGSVSVTEFFVTLASAFTFFILLGVSHWQTILGLIVGGLIAAPVAAKLAGRLPRKTAFVLVGILVIIWSIRILVKLM
ncbi:MAG: TSUP family transporter [Niabella sp.]